MLKEHQIIRAPIVRMIASSMLHHQSLNDLSNLLQFTRPNPTSPDLDALPEFAGRVCYWSFDNPRPGGTDVYLDRIKEQGHGSILEHSTITFFVAGISRPCAQELTRHRAGCAYSMLSQRYVDESDCRFVVPPEYLLPERASDLKVWRSAVEMSLVSYRSAVDLGYINHGVTRETAPTHLRKRVRQAARYLLAESVETRLVFTVNLRAMRHILEQRGSEHADLEIRRLVYAMLPYARLFAPNVFGDYVTNEHPSGVPTIYTKTPKV